MADNFNTPAWVKDAIFYQIFPDRYARSARLPKPKNLEDWDTPPTVQGFKGGDLFGVVEKLDYLSDLGINALYLNPIFQSASNHRYHTHDYFRVDPLLGGKAAFEELVKESHRRGMRVILDGVFNHASRGFYQFNHILECGKDSPYLDWFDVTGFPLNAYNDDKPLHYRSWWGLRALPEFNFHNPQVREFIFGVARYWLEQGIDGWRLDVPNCIDVPTFWQEFRQMVKSTNLNAYIVGEITTEAQNWLKGDKFDAVMNYQLTQACLGFFGGNKIDQGLAKGFMGLPPTSVLDAKTFSWRADELLNLYPREASYSQLNILNSHDMPRFLDLVSGDKDRYRLAVLFQMTYPGAPCIYYGDEIGITGGHTRKPEDARYAFPWEKPETWDNDLLKYYQGLIALRKKHPCLREGEFINLYAKDGIYAYLRYCFEEKLMVVINNQATSALLEIPVAGFFPDGAHLEAVWGKGVGRVVEGRLTRFALEPHSGIVFAP